MMPGTFPKKINGGGLKWIAMITMLIDHSAACLLYSFIIERYDALYLADTLNTYISVYQGMRAIGRLAFPIYIFLLVEGLFHTHSRGKYLGRLAIFALVSEIPFDLALQLFNDQVRSGIFWNMEGQNVFFTLAIGMLALTLIETVRHSRRLSMTTRDYFVEAGADPAELGEMEARGLRRFGNLRQALLAAVIAAACIWLANFLQTDYGGWGVGAILACYIWFVFGRKDLGFLSAVVVLTILSRLEACAFFAFIPIMMYNGQRGHSHISKWVFYIFYPAHLLILALLRLVLL